VTDLTPSEYRKLMISAVANGIIMAWLVISLFSAVLVGVVFVMLKH
jgi:hypothetical protein